MKVKAVKHIHEKKGKKESVSYHARDIYNPMKTVTSCCEGSKGFLDDIRVTLEQDGRFSLHLNHYPWLRIDYCPSCGAITELAVVEVKRYRKAMVEREEWLEVK